VRLRDEDGLKVEHIVHDVSREQFYRWARELLKDLEVTVV
jgi:hypothetical protein